MLTQREHPSNTALQEGHPNQWRGDLLLLVKIDRLRYV